MGLFAWFKRAHSGRISLALTDSESTTDVVDVRSYAGGTIRVGAGITSVTFWGKQVVGDSPLQYYNKDNEVITLTVAADKETQLPQEIYDMSFCVMVANTAGTVTVTLKG